MRGVVGVVIAQWILLAFTPGAGALENALGEPICRDEVGCLPTSVCLPGVYCQATPCDPATDCRASTRLNDTCTVKEEINGRTCATRAGAAASVGGRNIAVPGTWLIPGRPIPGMSVYVPQTGGDVALDLTRGFVRDHNLPNDWVSHAARVRLQVAGIPVGDTSVGVYQSSIDGNASADPHTYTHAVVTARHDSPAGGVGASVGVALLDGILEDCFVRAGANGDVEILCSDFTRSAVSDPE